MTTVQRLLRLNRRLEVWTIPSGKIAVQIKGAEVKDGACLVTDFGTGETFEEACDDYLGKISGKTLVLDSQYNRKEVMVL